MPGALDVLTSLVEWLEVKAEKRRSRRVLMTLTDSQLKDIGVSRSAASFEATRPFWD